MIKTTDLDYIRKHAYVPEHVLDYVTAISKAEPFLIRDFLVYVREERTIFVGYPLSETFEVKQMKRAIGEVTQRFKPEEIALTAPATPAGMGCLGTPGGDQYYRLDLSTLSVSQKVRNMLHRAARELSIETGKVFDEEHRELVRKFMGSHPTGEGTGIIFERIPEYISAGDTAWLFDARNGKGELVAFDIAEFKSKDYAFYMFNFSSDALYVPGASDLLLSEVIRQARKEGKKYINLGLGINPGVAFFKKKWSAVVFLPYTFCLYRPSKKENLEALLNRL